MQADKPFTEETNIEWRLLAEFTESEAGSKGPLENTLEILRGLGLPPTKFAQIHESIMHSIEYIQKAVSALDPPQSCFRIWVCTPGLGHLQASASDNQAGQSWGFFLITRGIPVSGSSRRWFIEIFLFLEGGSHDSSKC